MSGVTGGVANSQSTVPNPTPDKAASAAAAPVVPTNSGAGGADSLKGEVVQSRDDRGVVKVRRPDGKLETRYPVGGSSEVPDDVKVGAVPGRVESKIAGTTASVASSVSAGGVAVEVTSGKGAKVQLGALALAREWCVHESNSWLDIRITLSDDGEKAMRKYCSDERLEQLFADDPGSKDELFNDPDFVDVFVGESPSIIFSQYI